MVWTFRGGWRGALAISLLAVAGCGGGSHTVSFDDLVNDLIGTVCKFEVACNEMPDMATCLATTKLEPNYNATLKQDIASGKVRYDSAKAAACIDLIGRIYGAACSRAALAAIPDRDSNVCDQVFAGTVAVGGACFFGEECVDQGACAATDVNCLRTLQCCPGTCMAKTPIVPVGGSCSSGDICVDGSYCDTSVSGVAGTCRVPTAGEGAACSDAIPCAAPLFCDTDPATGMQTCRRPAATGAACSTGLALSSCDDGRDYCDQATGVCARRIVLGGDCASGQPCVGYADCVGSTCVARPKPGEACDSTNDTCLGSLTCDATTSTCTIVPVGGACM